MAGVLAAGDGSVLSHMSAAHLWGFSERSGPTEVTRPSSAGRAQNGDSQWGRDRISAATESGGRVPVLKVRTTRHLDSSEVTVHKGIPVTTVARVFVDICGSIGNGQLKRLLHEANRMGLLRFDELQAAMGRARGKRGIGRLRAILDDWDPQTALTRNELENRFLALCRKHRLPAPLVNQIVAGYRVDFFWPQYGLIVEIDGGRDHNAPHGIERDKDRDAYLQLRGFMILRLTRGMVEREAGRSMRKVEDHIELCVRQGRRASDGWASASIGGLAGGV